METLKLSIKEQEIPCTKEIETDTKEEVKLLTMGREWTKTERLKYLEFRKQEENNKKRKWKRYLQEKETYKPKPKKPRIRKSNNNFTKPPRQVWENCEHLCPKTRWWANHPDNLKSSNMLAHEWKHRYLWVQLPHEQIWTILNDNIKTLHPQTREMIVEEIQALIEYYLKWEEFYNPVCFREKTLIPKTL